MIEPLLTPRDAAEILGIPVEAVWRLTESGDLPAIKVGRSRYGRTRIRPEDLRDYQRRGRAR
jgi:excisionase family DNA binding protein